jgi:methyl-accepting chemotaxis protein
MFMARAMRDPQGAVLGVLAFQLPTDTIRNIMHFRSGMGESGETYLVGEDGLMRSPSRFVGASTVLTQKVETEAVIRALNKERGVMVTADYRGVEVLSAYDSESIGDFRWAVLAEIDRDEVLRDAAQRYPQIAGMMAFLYLLAMGSLWFLRSGDTVADDLAGLPEADPEYPDLPG